MDYLKRLDLNDITEMKELFFKTHQHDSRKRLIQILRPHVNFSTNIDLFNIIANRDIIEILNVIDLKNLSSEDKSTVYDAVTKNVNYELNSFWEIWIEGMKKYYLRGDKDHVLYGYFLEDKLVAQGGYRSDLPHPWNDGWLIVYLKSDPEIKNIFNFLKIIWDRIYEDCESRGFTKWHCLIEPDRQKKFDSWYRKSMSEINDRYEYSTTLNIPKGTRPDVDWVWGALGRKTANCDFILRTGTRKLNTRL